MAEETVFVTFSNVSPGEANSYISKLAQEIIEADAEVVVEKARERSNTQDFGAVLAIVLGSASATAVATGISHWLARHSGVRLEIKDKHGTILASNLDSRDAARIAQAISRSR